MAETSTQGKSARERMQEIKVALEVSDPKGVVAAELGKDRVTLDAIRKLLKIQHIRSENGSLYLTQTGREQPLISFQRMNVGE